MTGLIDELSTNEHQIQIINGELEKVLNRKKDKMLQESDMIELLDSTPGFGKRTGQANASLKPVVWVLLGTQMPTYVREMGTDSNGRLRFVMTTIDSAQVLATPFEEKLVPRNASNDLLVGVLRAILRAQHGIKMEAGPEDAAEDAEAEQKNKRICIRLPKQQQPNKGKAQSSPEVQTMQWTAAATLVLAGVMDGSGQACEKGGKTTATSTVTKLSGKAFGAMATANVAMRNGLLRFALSEKAPLDNQVRILDSLAAIPKMELASVNQLLAEMLIQQQKLQMEKRTAENKAEPKIEEIPNLDDVDFAARRLFDALGKETDGDRFLIDQAVDPGIPLKINAKTPWYNFRQLYFARSRKRQQGRDVQKKPLFEVANHVTHLPLNSIQVVF